MREGVRQAIGTLRRYPRGDGRDLPQVLGSISRTIALEFLPNLHARVGDED